MSGVNKVTLLGNVGKDPEVKYLDSGVAVASFPLATSETFKDKAGEKQTVTEWHNIILWRGLAEVAEKYVKKGSKLYIEGKIKTEMTEHEGVKKYYTKIIGRELTMLDSKPSGNGHNTEEPIEATGVPDSSDDLPF